MFFVSKCKIVTILWKDIWLLEHYFLLIGMKVHPDLKELINKTRNMFKQIFRKIKFTLKLIWKPQVDILKVILSFSKNKAEDWTDKCPFP